MDHCNMPMGQMWWRNIQDHGQCVVAHGKEVEHLKHPMDHCNMPVGQMSCRTEKAHGAEAEHLECAMVHSNIPMGHRLNCQNVPWDKYNAEKERTMGNA